VGWRWEPNRAAMKDTARAFADDKCQRLATTIEVMARVELLNHVDTGRTLAELRSEGPLWDGPDQRIMKVGSDTPGALWLESGARKHIILPHRPPYAMHFFWERKNAYVFLTRVRHPGFKRVPWLTESAKTQARLQGWKFRAETLSTIRGLIDRG